MSYSIYRYKTFHGAHEQEQVGEQGNMVVQQAYPGKVDRLSYGDVAPAALASITCGVGMNQSPLQFISAIDIAQGRYGNRAMLEFVRLQQIRRAAGAGFRDSGQSYPFLEEIQGSFGKHDISGLKGHTGEAARAANDALGSRAYHKGGHVAFGVKPTLADAAHEAAHYVQGVSAGRLEGGVGQAGDIYERHAERVAAAVVAGELAEPLLDQAPGGIGAPAAVRGDGPVQMIGGLSGKKDKPTESEGEEKPKQKRLSRNIPPPLGVSRKYNPVSREMTTANERGVDQGNPRNGRELRTAGNIVGPLPGPAGHREFFYIIKSQDRRVHGAMTEAHAMAGLLKLDEEGKFEDGMIIHRLRDDYVMEEEEFALDTDGKKIPSITTQATDGGWMAGGIATSAYRAKGMRSLAVGYNIELVRAQQGLLQGAMGIYLLPISNYDEMGKLFQTHLHPRDEDRASCEDVNTDTGLFWLIDSASERNPVRSCLDLHNVLLKRAKPVGAGGEVVDLDVRHPQSVTEHFRTLHRLNQDYFRFYDRDDIAVRVAIENNFIRRMLDHHAMSGTYEDAQGKLWPKPVEEPPPRMPYPQDLNESRGYIPKHNPYASFTNPVLLASYLSATESELPQNLEEIWKKMPDDIKLATADSIVRMFTDLQDLRERRARTENEQEKLRLDRQILPFEQVLEQGGLENVPWDIKLLVRKKMGS